MAGSVSFGQAPARSFALRAIGVVVVVIVAIVALSSCATRVDAGHVGIRVKLAGSSRGVDDIPVVTGWVFINPLSEQLVMFPISVQNVVWTKDPHEGNAHDESITFSSQEGVNINADIGLSFHIEPSLAPHLYLRFRKANLIELSNGYVRNAVRESFNIVASGMPVQNIYGADKAKLVQEVTKRMTDLLAKDGFVIDQLTINGALRLPDNVAAAINRAMEQTQQAIQAENRVRQVRAEAEQAITQAEGQATAARARARGEADARLITSRAEAKANLILRASTSASVLQYRALEKWNGHLPVMNGGGALPMLTFDAGKVAKASADEDKLLHDLLGEDDSDLRKGDAKDESKDSKDSKDSKEVAAPDAPAAPDAAKK
ncbi:MAG TPA: prohibitin family protein [Polyangia bacterium]|jgi:regulator of protease activity HflC (stomatin/prohibitin superfamily)|nr:prohibitin family protein [Polyangia bacterium]